MMRLGILCLFFLSMVISLPTYAKDAEQPVKVDWPFDGILGKYNQQSLQNGLQVYLNSCTYCHSLKLVAYRNLTEIGLSEDVVKAIAAEATVNDGPDEFGEMFDRPAVLSDRFALPFPNDQAARFANGGALPPDLSLIVKARKGGANYLFSILTGYIDPPLGVEVAEGMMYNPYFPGGQISMPSPLYEGMLVNDDGVPFTIDQMAYDVTQFLVWASEPKMEMRKKMGISVIIFLIIMTGLFIAVKRRVWASLH